MPIDEKAVWQRVTAASEKRCDPLGEALEEARVLLRAVSALSAGREPWTELLRSQRKTLRALRGLGRLLGTENEETPVGKKSPLPGKSYREKLCWLLERQEQQARGLEALAGGLGDPAARVVRQEVERAWERWRLLLEELGR